MSKKYMVYLNVLSSLAVVILHTNHVFLSFSYDRYWISANMLESLFYFAVPIFFMMSGANLIDYKSKYTTVEYTKKRIEKTLIPFLVWTGMAYVYKTFIINPSPLASSPITMEKSLKWCFIILIMIVLLKYLEKIYRHVFITKFCIVLTGVIAVIHLTSYDDIILVINSIFNTHYMPIYWYFISQSSIYMMIPIFASIPADKRQHIFGLIISLTFICGFLLQFIIMLIPNMQYNREFLPPFTQYIWYAIVGYYIDCYSIKKQHRNIIYFLGILGIGLHLIGTYILSIQAGEIIHTFKGYLNLPTVMYSIAVFVFFKYLPEKYYEGIIYKICLWIAPTTFGVYLIHQFIIDTNNRFALIDPKLLVYRTLGAVVIFALSVVLVTIYQMIKKCRVK